MKTFNIYKKRDGQSFKQVSSIYADTFEEAKKEFANNMTKDNHNQSNNIVWLDAETDGVNVTGFYDFNGGSPAWNVETEKYDAREATDYLFVSEEAIKEGFSSWNEDVYTWEVRDVLDCAEIWNMKDFEDEKGNYKYFMAVDRERFFLYNGLFNPIAEAEGFGYYSDRNEKFMGSGLDDVQFIESILN